VIDNYDDDYAVDDDTRVMTIPQLFSLKNSRAKNNLCSKGLK